MSTVQNPPFYYACYLLLGLSIVPAVPGAFLSVEFAAVTTEADMIESFGELIVPP